MIDSWCYIFNSSSSRCSIRQFNGCLFVPLVTVILKAKMDQDASAVETEGSVLTDVRSAKSKDFDS